MASRTAPFANAAECLRKRPQRKGNLTKLENTIEDMNKLEFERRSIVLLERSVRDAIHFQEDYEFVQNSLIEFMIDGVDTDDSLEKERKDLLDASARFENAHAILKGMEDDARQYQTFSDLQEEVETILELLEGADFSLESTQEEVLRVRHHMPLLSKAYSKIPRKFRVNLSKTHSDLQKKAKQAESAAGPSMASKKPSTPIMDTSSTASPASSTYKRSRLPNIEFPKFYGDKLLWPLFWEVFIGIINKDDRLEESDKIAYLKASVKTAEAESAIADLTGAPGDFASVSKVLEELYSDPHLIYRAQLRDVCEGKLVDKAGAKQWLKTLRKLEKTMEKAGQYTAQHMLSALGELKFTGKLKKDWLDGAGDSRKVPELDDLMTFLEKAARRYMIGQEDKLKPTPVVQPPNKSKKPVMYTNNSMPVSEPTQGGELRSTVRSEKPCQLCKVDRHSIYMCPDFKAMSVMQRKEVVQRLKLCDNCLAYNHQLATCRSKRTCMTCHQKHNTLLHEPGSGGGVGTSGTPQPTTPTTTALRAAYLANAAPAGGILPTAVVTVKADDVELKARVVLDNCSELSFVTSSMARQLKATIHQGHAQASGVGDVHGLQCREFAFITVSPEDTTQDPPVTVQAYISPSVSMVLPHADLSAVKDLPFLQGVPLADPSFFRPGRLDMLLGLEATSHMTNKRVSSSADKRYHAINTIYGNVIMGWNREDHQKAAVYLTERGPPTDLSQFWEVEDSPKHPPTLSRDEVQALEHFTDTVTREKDGRYVVQLPKKIPTPALGYSKQRAERRFLQNEKALQNKGQWKKFQTVVDEYGECQHAEVVPGPEMTKPETDCFYLPMHGIIKEASTTTKLRVVFDASAKTSNGLALNDILHAGPNQYPLLTTILTKFRSYQYGMTADISKMFREVSLDKNDRDLHRFLWRDDAHQLQVWRMTRVTFGVTSSPFLATQTLLQLAQDYQQEFPRAAEVIKKNFYVDDCLTGADTLDEAVTLRMELNALLDKGKMTLRKWRTNSEDLKATIPEEICESEPVQHVFSPELSHKTLGVHWDPTSDQMYLSAPKLEVDTKATKRQVSSDLARTYDVMGWFAPAMVKAKSLIQALWVMKLGWDDDVPEDIAASWKQWTSELHELTQHPVPRCYFSKHRTRVSVQLHGFSDASKVAYGGVIYLRTFYEDTSTTVSLVTARTRVAPTRTQTIPRLELCGALLTSKLLAEVQKILGVDSTQVYAWTDSMIVLGWLGQSPGRLVVFAANRVVAITKNVPTNRWKHVPTDSNPADAASRGLTPKELLAHDLWWKGPSWLYMDPTHWPQGPKKKTIELPGIRKAVVLITHCKTTLNPLIERYSSLKRLVRITAWLLRFTENCYKRIRTATDHRLATDELVRAELLLVRSVQQEHYSKEIESLSQNQEIRLTSSIVSLRPLLDDSRILRVGGRLENSDLPYPTKHPAILPKRSTLVKLILRRLHEDNKHVGTSTMMGLLSEEYHVVGARAAIRDLTKNCVVCRKAHAKHAQQLMGQLPAYRSTITAAFTHVGTDFAGPIIVKSGNPRKPRLTKAFICILVCMSTKAVHIEVVSDLTTNAFLAALHRFCSRRGRPQTIYSDNGTNFVGAGRELAEAYSLLKDKHSADVIHNDLAEFRVEWKHTPSRAPHFGGLWEANVKQIKILLRKSVGGVNLTYEELDTVLVQIEGILNSRPLVPMNTQSSDGELALTPGHFLIGRPLQALPCIQDYRPGNLLRRWNLCQRLVKQFGDQWSREYLISLNKLNKWIRPQRNLQIGDVVLVKDLGLFCNAWPLGLITNVQPGQDGRVRTATVRMKNGEFQRPIVKLTLLLPEKDQTSFPPRRMDAPAKSTPRT